MSALPPLLERLAIAGLAMAAIYLALVPFGAPGAPPMPDLVYCLLAAWVIRRPARAPLWMVVGLGLVADLMLSRPLGLGALGLLVVSERLRAHTGLLHGHGFVVEWLAVALGFAVLLAIMQAGLLFVFADAPSVPVLLWYLATTVLAYPLVVAGLAGLIGLRMPQAGRGSVVPGRLR